MTIAFLVWYLAYVLLSTYAEGFMSIQVIGNLNLGIILGLSQFVMTFLITWLYIRHANKNLDPVSSRIRDELEGTL
ncbi:Putative membrane protein (Fragment) [Corynebacterium xerosis]